MDKYKVKLNPRAFRDLDEIFAYIALERLSPENARGQTNRIIEKIGNISAGISGTYGRAICWKRLSSVIS